MTWNDDLFPFKILYALDKEVKKIDPAWPIVAKSAEAPAVATVPPIVASSQTTGSVPPAVVPTTIHVNPAFLNLKKVWRSYKKTEIF